MDSIPDEEDATGIDIFLEPPDDGAESDADDPSEDVADVGEENVKLLGARLLAKPAHVEFTNRNSQIDPCSSRTIPVDFQEGKAVGNDEGELMPPSKKKKKQKPVKPCYTWQKCNFEATPDTEEPVLESHKPFILHKWSDEGVTPVGIFKELWNDDLMKLIMTETNRYHQAKFGKELFVTVEELYKVFGIFYFPDTTKCQIVVFIGQGNLTHETLLLLSVGWESTGLKKLCGASTSQTILKNQQMIRSIKYGLCSITSTRCSLTLPNHSP